MIYSFLICYRCSFGALIISVKVVTASQIPLLIKPSTLGCSLSTSNVTQKESFNWNSRLPPPIYHVNSLCMYAHVNRLFFSHSYVLLIRIDSIYSVALLQKKKKSFLFLCSIKTTVGQNGFMFNIPSAYYQDAFGPKCQEYFVFLSSLFHIRLKYKTRMILITGT